MNPRPEDDNDRARADAALLDELAALAREERAREPDAAALADLESLAAGTLAPADHARLVADQPSSTVRLFEPLGTDFQARATQSALAGLGLAATEPAPISPPDTKPVTVTPLLPNRRRLAWALLPLAAAAGLALWVLRPPPRERLAEYTLELRGGLMDVRYASDDAAAKALPKFGPGARLDLVLRPSRESTRPVVAQAWLVRDGKMQPWAVVPEVSAAGAVRVAGTFEALGLSALEPGEWEAVVVVAPTDQSPDEPEIQAALADPPPSDAPWRLQRGRFLVERAP